MGVKGLKTFIKNNANQILQPIRLHDTHLVIDGANLKFQIYFETTAKTKDYILGGNFPSFASECRWFFNRLKQCNITPIVIFDGATSSDDKIDTLLARNKKTLMNSKRISNGESFEGSFLPYLMNLAMNTVLNELGIKYLQSTEEADQEIAAIANKIGCPVFSMDSDFFIFNLKGGLVLIDSIDFNYQKRVDYDYIDCWFYHADNLVRNFPGLNKNLLPLFSCLIGNDYVPRVTDKINQINRQSLIEVCHLKIERQESIVLLLNWMRNKTLDEIIELFEIDSMEDGKQRLRLMDEIYKINEEPELFKYLSNKNNPSVLNCDLSVLKKNDLPDWFVEEFNLCRYDSWLMKIIVFKRYPLVQNVQNFNWPSVHQFASPLRRIIYGLLQSDDDPVTIEEYDRNDDQYVKLSAQSTLYLANGKKIPNLSQLRRLNKPHQMSLMLDILNTNREFFDKMCKSLGPLNRNLACLDSFKFLNLTIRYWITEAGVPVWIEFVYALVINYLFAAHIDKNIDLSHFSFSFDFKDTRKAAEKLKIFWNNTTSRDFFRKQNVKPFQPEIVHFFLQFKICLNIVISLNSLLDYPFDVFQFPFYFLNGPFLYDLTVELKSNQDLNSYLKQLIGPNYFDVIEKIIAVLINGLDDSQITKRDTNNYGETAKKTTRNTQQGNKNSLKNKLSLLSIK